MTDYFVRKTGNDVNAGTSAGAAWLTIDKAANTVAAGDTVYIGAGLYRELVTMDTSGSSGNVINYIADIDGSQTGDAGLVIVSAFDTDTAAPTRASCLDLNGKTFITWQDIVFDGGSSQCITGVTGGNDSYEAVTLDGCVVIASEDASGTVNLNIGNGAEPTSTGITLTGCAIHGMFSITYDQNATADIDLKATVENCIFLGYGRSGTGGTTNCAIRLYRNSASTFDCGGIDINNCTFIGYENTVIAYRCDNTTDTVAVANSLFAHCQTGIERNLGTAGSIVSNGNNRFTDVFDAFSDVTADASDNETGSFSMLGGIADLPLYRRLGWSPFRPWEPIALSGYTSPLINNGSATYAPATDIYGEPRPMGSADDIGAVEARGRGARSATWAADASTYSMAFTSIGYHEMMIPVNTESTTVSVKAYKDASYTGTAPKLEVLIGDTSQGTDSMTVGTETEETLSVNFTPSAAGWARVRLWSYATAGTVFFDTVSV